MLVVSALVGLPKLLAASKAEVTADDFFAALTRGDVDRAYGLLSEARRARMSRDAFATFVDHPALRHPTASELFVPAETRDQVLPGRCLTGWLTTERGEWMVQAFLVEDAPEQWRIRSLALDAPENRHPEYLLMECGYAEWRYRGWPGPDRRTPPLD